MDSKKLSIIIPVYNSEQYLRESLDSVAGSSYSNLEILLVDDDSSDSSSDICKERAASDPRFSYLHKLNGGVASARNVGLSAATGEYIAFMDNDDFVHPDMYEVLVELLDSYEADIAACGFLKTGNCAEVSESAGDHLISGNTEPQVFEGSPQIINSATRSNDSIEGMVWNKVYRREAICGRGVRFDEDVSLVDDALFSIELFMSVKRVVYIPNQLYFWMQHGDNQTIKSNWQRYVSAMRGYDRILDLVKDGYPDSAPNIASQYVDWIWTATRAAKAQGAYEEIASECGRRIRDLKQWFWKWGLKQKVKATLLFLGR